MCFSVSSTSSGFSNSIYVLSLDRWGCILSTDMSVINFPRVGVYLHGVILGHVHGEPPDVHFGGFGGRFLPFLFIFLSFGRFEFGGGAPPQPVIFALRKTLRPREVLLELEMQDMLELLRGWRLRMSRSCCWRPCWGPNWRWSQLRPGAAATALEALHHF